MTLPVFKHAIKRGRQTESCSTSSFELASSSAACQLRHSYKVHNCSAPDMLYDSTMCLRILYRMNLDMARFFGNEDHIIFWVIDVSTKKRQQETRKANFPTKEAWNFATKKMGTTPWFFGTTRNPYSKTKSLFFNPWWNGGISKRNGGLDPLLIIFGHQRLFQMCLIYESLIYETVFLQQCFFNRNMVYNNVFVCWESLWLLLQTAPLHGVVRLPEDVGSQRFFPLPAASESTCTVRC